MDGDEMAEAGSGHTPGADPPRRIRGGVLRELVLVVVGALVISALIRAFLGQMFVVPTPSMTNTLLVGDKVVASRISELHRGDVVVFADPGGWVRTPPKQRSLPGKALELVGVLPSTSRNYLVKRVVGMPGDHVHCCDRQGRMSINGVVLDEHTYLNSVSGRASDFEFDVVVPAGHMFVMGDHRDVSDDSRCKLDRAGGPGQPVGQGAFVPLDDVVGPVVATVAPLGRWRSFAVPDDFTSVPAPASVPATGSLSVSDPTC